MNGGQKSCQKQSRIADLRFTDRREPLKKFRPAQLPCDHKKPQQYHQQIQAAASALRPFCDMIPCIFDGTDDRLLHTRCVVAYLQLSGLSISINRFTSIQSPDRAFQYPLTSGAGHSFDIKCLLLHKNLRIRTSSNFQTGQRSRLKRKLERPKRHFPPDRPLL